MQGTGNGLGRNITSKHMALEHTAVFVPRHKSEVSGKDRDGGIGTGIKQGKDEAGQRLVGAGIAEPAGHWEGR